MQGIYELETAEVEIADLWEDLDKACWDLEECCRSTELNVARAIDSVRKEVKGRHSKELAMKDEIIMLRSCPQRKEALVLA